MNSMPSVAEAATFVPPLLVVLPILAAAIVRIPRLPGRVVSGVAIGTCAVVSALSLWLLPAVLDEPVVHVVGGWGVRDGLVIGIPLVADGIAVGFVALAAVLVTAGLGYLAVSQEGHAATDVLTLLVLAAVAGFLLAGDVFTLFVFLELFGIAVYAVTAGKVEDPAALPAAINVAVISTIGAVLFLTGVGLLYRLSGSPNIAQTGQALAGAPADPALAVTVALVVGGLAVKTGLVPFHFAHADLHTASWSPHAGLLGAVMLPLGLYGIARLQTAGFGGITGLDSMVRPVLLAAAVATALIGGAMALMQDQLKRMLAFSSISHVGIAGVAVAFGTATGTAAAALYVVGHGAVKVGLMLVAGVLLHRVGSLTFTELAGRGRDVPVAMGLLAVGALLLAGAPPSGLFAGKAVMTDAAQEVGLGWIMPLVYLAAALTGAAVLRAASHLWFGWPVPHDDIGVVAEHRPDELLTRTPRTLLAIPLVLVTIGGLLPLAPGVLTGAGRAAASFADAEIYTAAVLGDVPPEVVPTEPEPWKASSLAAGAGAAMIAVVLGPWVARRWRRSPRAMTAPMRWLRRAHTGLVNDQVTWLTAAIGGWCAWMVASTGS
jgi:multicomponent Na+:H+ antiporter subunit D